MVDASFVSAVVAQLISQHREWRGGSRLVDVVSTRFAGDPVAVGVLVSVVEAGPELPPERLTDRLGEAVRSHAEADAGFLVELRQFVIAAYADPFVAADLPDPSPRL